MSELTLPTAAPAPPAIRDTRLSHHLSNLRLIAVSYLVDGFFLMLFCLAGTIGWVPVVAYTGLALLQTALFYGLIARGWTQRFRDTGIAIPQTIPGQVQQLACIALVPEVNFMFALLLFLVYGTLTLALDVRRSLVGWALVAASIGAIVVLFETPLQIPSASLAEQAISFGFFIFTLWRCLLIGSFNRHMTARLKSRGKELEALTAQVDQLAHHDELTGVMNRRSLLDALRDEMQRAERSRQPLCVALLDLDHFKAVNDRLGHLAGDRTLRIFAETIAGLTRRADRFGRYGGEEFLLVMTGTDLDTAHTPIDRMRAALTTTDWSAVARGHSVTFSCGLARHEAGESLESLLQRADEALYRAKRGGRNCTRVG